jgi:hypothetical protein
MYEDLQALASLKINKAIEQLTQDAERQLVATSRRAGASFLTGGAEAQRFNIRAGAQESICRTIADTWTALLVKRSRRLTRDDLNFIMQEVETHALSQAKPLGFAMVNTPGGPLVGGNYWMEQADTRMRKVIGDIRRDLEIRIREQQAFPPSKAIAPKSPSVPIQLHIQNANISNLNLGTQMGTINAALQLLSTEGKNHQALADAIKQLTEAVVADRQLNDEQKHEAVEALSVLASDAKSGKVTVTTKALVSWLPTVVGLSADLMTVWDKVGPALLAFFKA